MGDDGVVPSLPLNRLEAAQFMKRVWVRGNEDRFAFF